MNSDESIAIAVLLGMKESLFPPPGNVDMQSGTGRNHKRRILMNGTGSKVSTNAKRIKKINNKHSNTKRSNDKISRADCSTSEVSINKSVQVEVKTKIRAKKNVKVAVLSPVSVVDTMVHEGFPPNSKGTTNIALLPTFPDKTESSDQILINNMMSPKMASHTLYPDIAPSAVAITHQTAPMILATEPVLSHIITPLWGGQVQEQQHNDRPLLLTQDMVKALLTAEIQKMTVLVQAQQKELQSANHARDCIVSALQLQHPTSPTLLLGSTSLSSLLQPSHHLECIVPTISFPDSQNSNNTAAATTSLGGNGCCNTTTTDGITNTLLLNLLQQAITSNSFA